MRKKLTDWIDGSVKPSLPGVYERRVPGGAAYWYWNGRRWDFGGNIRLQDCHPSGAPSSQQDLPWRGLAASPKEQP